MKKHHTPARRAAWLSFAAPALLATPAFAQDAPTPPPPVSVTVPQAPPPAAAPAATPAPAPAAAPTTTTESRTTIAPGAADVVDEARIEAAREARATPARRTARATPARATPAQPTASAPVAAAPAPVAAAPEPAPAAVTPAPAPVADAPAETAATTTTTTAEDSGAPLWPIALIAALIVAVGAFFLMRRRRADADEEVYVEEAQYEAEPAYVAPVEPAYVAPVAATSDDVVVTDAPAEDVAALTDGAAPVRNRPWLEFAMRPVRAGTSADEALVEIELTVANSGNVEAHDVRVSTFMLTDAHASEMERMMVDAPADAAIEPVSIAPGEGTRIDATLAALKSDLGSDGRFNPVVVAEARYRLADGSEGRTSASFVVGVSDADGGAMTGIDLADRVMRDDVEAQLHGEVEHA